jgi:hypothetical protein
MMYLSNRMRLAKTIEGLFYRINPDTPLFSNLYQIEWLSSNQGMIVNIKRIARLKLNGECENEIVHITPNEINEFKEFTEVFSVCFMFSQKTKLKKLKRLKMYVPSADNLEHRFTANLLLAEGISTTYRDIMKTRRVNPPDFLPF